MKNRVLDLFHSFRYRDYRFLWVIVALVNTASWSFTLGVTSQVFSLTHSTFWSGAIMFASMVPNLIGAPLVGVLADKLERRQLILISIALVILTLLTLTVTSIAGVLAPSGMVVLALLFGLASSTISVAINAILPGLVPRTELYNAYSLQAVGQRGTEFIGPFAASPLLALWGPQAVYIFGAVMFVLAIWFVIALSTPKAEETLKPSSPQFGFFHSLREGFSYIRRNRQIYGIIILVGLHCSLTMAFMGMLPGFVQNQLLAPSSFYGLLMSMVGLGAIFATLWLAGVRSSQFRRMLFWASGLLSGLSLAFLGLSSTRTIAIIAILLVGASQAMFMTITGAMVQELTEERVRGRVTSVYFVLAAGLMSLANWVYGAIAKFVHPTLIMLVTGLLFVVAMAAYRVVTAKPDLGQGVQDSLSL
ncbi:MFS transporter [Alicyclobacillus ferrooxydans]|uniref:Major facilitator superfamily (MFS) profile domain-containing protein n=1 Tax=Alicyclobacillus ferrooxydans TaxID=471514 RepID=A0A0P9EGC9_9BACL|nr:MFS transporter [Alicyclobacillus ferrooxydans]KPV41586.1 hypothetical protein AN477_20660 [Alicyclobacillus ferrooxydans]